jgi:chromosome segregation ATPase
MSNVELRRFVPVWGGTGGVPFRLGMVKRMGDLPLWLQVVAVFGGLCGAGSGVAAMWNAWRQRRVDGNEEERKEAAAEVDIQRRLDDQKESILNRWRTEIDRMDARAAAQDAKIERQATRIAALENTVEELQQSLEAAQTALAQKQRELAAAEAEARRLILLTAGQAAEIGTLQAEIGDLKAAVRALTLERDALLERTA